MRVVPLSWMDIIAVVAALVLCGLIGFEREMRRKDAGIRTHILVGLGSCLFTMVSIEGVPAVVGASVTWDASRIAAQVVTGIGFLGAGVIFFNHDTVRGLTTACAVWIAAAVGMACGAGMFPLALLITGLYFVVVLAIAPFVMLLLKRDRDYVIRVTYQDGKGVLRQALMLAAQHGFETQVVSTRDVDGDSWQGAAVELRLAGSKNGLHGCIEDIAQLDGVHDIDVLARDD